MVLDDRGGAGGDCPSIPPKGEGGASESAGSEPWNDVLPDLDLALDPLRDHDRDLLMLGYIFSACLLLAATGVPLGLVAFRLGRKVLLLPHLPRLPLLLGHQCR